MDKQLYLECAAGISGDMTVAALLDLGADEKGLLEVLNNLTVDGYAVKISRVKKAGLDCLDFDVVLDKEHENHDHDMEYLYGTSHNHDHNHIHDHNYESEQGHSHEHGHSNYEHSHEHGHSNYDQNYEHSHESGHSNYDHNHDHSHSHHVHRGFYDIKKIIDASKLTDNAKAIATKIFEIIANAEAKAHGETFENVHFHEVGAVDSIVDVIAVAYCFDNLGIKDVVVRSLVEGYGTVRCQHGILPVPVPAVTNIVSEYGIPLEIIDQKGELVTPTGAAIVAAVRTSDAIPKTMRIIKVGLGAGKREYERAGILRAMIITG